MEFFSTPNPNEEAIRAHERKRIEEERIRTSERENHLLMRKVKAGIWIAGVSLVLIFIAWGWLGWPTSGTALADGFDHAGAPLPDFVARALRK